MVAIRGDDVVVFLHQRNAAHGDRFLSYIEMEEATHLSAAVILQGDLLEAADAADCTVIVIFCSASERRIHGRISMLDRSGGGLRGHGGGKRTRW